MNRTNNVEIRKCCVISGPFHHQTVSPLSLNASKLRITAFLPAVRVFLTHSGTDVPLYTYLSIRQRVRWQNLFLHMRKHYHTMLGL